MDTIEWGKPDDDPQAPLIEPIADDTVQPVEPIQAEEPKKLTVLFGYGKVLPHLTHYVDEIKFHGGVAEGVEYQRALKLKSGPNISGVILMPPESTRKDWIHATGLNPADLTKIPKQWRGTQSDFAAIIDEYGIEGVRQMARDLETEIYKRDAPPLQENMPARFRKNGK